MNWDKPKWYGEYWWLIMIDDTENSNPIGEWDMYVIWYNIPKLIYKWIKVHLSNVNYSLSMQHLSFYEDGEYDDEITKFVLVDNWEMK